MSEIGKIRRSQIISTYGPGSIIDFRSPAGAPVSAISGGLEDWDESSFRKGLQNDQVINEPRLEKKLGVDGFRTPPVGNEKTGRRDKEGRPVTRARQIPAMRFPNWQFCPSCDLLQHTNFWSQDTGKDELYCPQCSGRPGKPKKQFVVPVRFVVACENGHLGEFPWQDWCDHSEGCEKKAPLKLLSHGAGLSGLYVLCTSCGGKKSMGKAFSTGSLARIGHKCWGHSPWLPKAAEVCDKPPAVIQRGASNAYFPIVESSIDIPPWGDGFQEQLHQYWGGLKAMVDRSQIKTLVELGIMPTWDGPKMSVDEMVAKINLRLQLLDGVNAEDLRLEEYAHLTSSESEDTGGEKPTFQIAPELVPSFWRRHLSHLVRVERLREVRALKGFTRLTPMEGQQSDRQMAPLSIQPQKWLPAVEVFGEGIFISLDEKTLSSWEGRDDVQERVESLQVAVLRDWQERNGTEVPLPVPITPRFVMIHTLAHAFIKRLSLDCGYSSSSVRERLYVGEGEQPMSGFLVYTSAPDADGTLGGLSREGKAERVGTILVQAIQDTEWCSSDPLCSDGINSFLDHSNLSACHACSFLPETACEHFNHYLDRALLTGTLENPELGFFAELLKEHN